MPSATVDGRFHPGRRERLGRCKDGCCNCLAPCGGGCSNAVGSGHCSGECRWSCCGKTGRRSGWPGCQVPHGSEVVDGRFHPGVRERLGRCKDGCCTCRCPCGGSCANEVGDGMCAGTCRWTCCGMTGRRSSWPGCQSATDPPPSSKAASADVGGPVTPGTARAGLRVSRGIDWKWGQQDGGEGGLGRLVKAAREEGWWTVCWDIGREDSYRVGKDGCFDLLVAADHGCSAGGGGRSLRVGDKVKLALGFESMSDAAGGPLGPGRVGEVMEDDGSWKPYKVRCGTREWWYMAEALQPASEAAPSQRRRLTSGDSVQLSKGFANASDAADGPLRPGDIGTIVRDDHSNMPYQVDFEGRKWWYMEGALVIAGTSERAEPVAAAVVNVGDRVRLAPGFERQSDAKSGPLSPGDVGKVVEDAGTDQRCRVVFKTSAWWYDTAALEVVDRASGRTIVTAALARPGLRVVRGKDWMWGDQDGGPGRTGSLERAGNPGWWYVEWDAGGSNTYRVGADGSHDLHLDQVDGASPSAASPQRATPGEKVTRSLVRPGLRVMRGLDWKWADQDGGAGKQGAIRPSFLELPGWCSVHWDEGGSFNYRCGEGGAFDLAVAPCGGVGSSAPPSRFQEGSLVCLTDSYAAHSDAALGPLEPGDKAVVVKTGLSRFQVEAGGRKWWYDTAALKPWSVKAEAATAPVGVEPPNTPASRINQTSRVRPETRGNADPVGNAAPATSSVSSSSNVPPPPQPPTPIAADLQRQRRPIDERTLEVSLFKELYEKHAKPPEYQHQVMAAVQGLISVHCEEQQIPPEVGKKFFELLQAEIFLKAEGLDEVLGQVCCAARRLWTSGITLPAENPLQKLELSHIINQALRDDGRAALDHVAVLARAVNSLTMARAGSRELSGHFPSGGRLWRGGGLPAEHRGFYEVTKKYRVPGFLASSEKKEVTDSFVYRAWDAGVPPVLWHIELDPRGEKEFKYRCKHVNYVTNSHFEGGQSEAEYLFAPYSVFTVKKVDWKDSPNDDNPHEVFLAAAVDNRKEPEDLPLAPWF